jgi:hypothetical protein
MPHHVVDRQDRGDTDQHGGVLLGDEVHRPRPLARQPRPEGKLSRGRPAARPERARCFDEARPRRSRDHVGATPHEDAQSFGQCLGVEGGRERGDVGGRPEAGAALEAALQATPIEPTAPLPATSRTTAGSPSSRSDIATTSH